MIPGNLAERLPILEVAADCIISKMGDITIALEIEKPEIFTLGKDDYDHLHQAYTKALKVLPVGAVFHMQDIYRQDRWAASSPIKTTTFLANSSDQFFNDRPYLRHECRIFLTLKPKDRRAVTSSSSGLLRSVLVPADTLDAAKIQSFEDSVHQFTRILTDSGLLTLRRITTKELISTAKRTGIIERYCYLSEQDQPPVLRDIDLGQPIRVGEQTCLLYTLADPADMPGTCSPQTPYGKFSTESATVPVGFTAGLNLLLPFNHLTNLYIIIGDQAATLKRLEARRLRLQSLSKLSRENTVSMEATGAFLNEAVSQQRQAVKWHVNLLAWTDDATELKEIRTSVSSAMAAMDATTHIETVGAPQLWWAGIPGNAGDLPENECMDTFLEQACCFIPYETNYRSSTSSFGVRFGDRLTGRPVHVDMDIEARDRGWVQNGNLFVLSGSGGGKSYLMNHLCRSYHDQAMHILIVDVGHSYQVLCRLLGGYYFTYEEANPIRFNPFYLAPGEMFDTEKKESLKALLLALWKKSDEGHQRSEYVALSNAIQAFYDGMRGQPEVFACFDSFYEFIKGDYVDLLRAQGVKPKEFDVENFLYVLRPYYHGGEFDYLLNATQNLDLLSERFIVFELDNIKDHPILFPIVTLVIMEVFLSKMRRLRGVRKMIVIEEAWKAIAGAGMAENIRYWVKTLRKFMGKLALVSQEVEDIVSSPIIKQAIINNSDIKILLDQSKFANRFDEIQALLGLSDKQKAEILSINKGHDAGRPYKDCWIGLGPTHSRVYRLETSLEEYLAYTSDQGEKVKLEEYAARYGGWREGIEALAGEMRGEGSGR